MSMSNIAGLERPIFKLRAPAYDLLLIETRYRMAILYIPRTKLGLAIESSFSIGNGIGSSTILEDKSPISGLQDRL